MKTIQVRQPSAAEQLLKLALKEDVRTHAKAMAPSWDVKPETRPKDAAKQAAWEASLY